MDSVGLNGFGCTLSSENSNGNWLGSFLDDSASLIVTVPSTFTYGTPLLPQASRINLTFVDMVASSPSSAWSLTWQLILNNSFKAG